MFDSLGFNYLKMSFFGGLLGFSFSLVLSVELNNPFTVLGGYFYYICLTSHGLMMIFYFLTLLSLSFYNYFLSSMGFLSFSFWLLKLGNLSLLLTTMSLILMVVALLLGEGLNGGWTLYTPLTSKSHTTMICLDLMLLGLNLYLMSSVTSSLVVLWGLMTSFFSFESFLDIPIFIWSFTLTSTLILFSTPSLFCVLTMLLLDSNFNTFYFDCEFGGSSVLFQSLFWFYSHPAVYMVILPIFGVVSHTLSCICGGFLYNKNGMVFSMLSLSVLSFLVWGHHMATVGWGVDVKNFFMMTTLMISLPTGVKVFSWIYTLIIYGGSFNLVSGFLSLFMMFFSLGGITGVFLANYSMDVMFHDSFFVVGHFHTVLSSASVFGLLSGVFLFSSSLLNLSFYKVKHTTMLWIYFFMSLTTSMTQFMASLHILGVLGLPSSVFNFSISNHLVLHTGSLSFFGVWLTLVVFIFLFLKNLNESKTN